MNNIIARLSCALLACTTLLGCQSHVVRPSGADMSAFGMVADPETREWQTDLDIARTLELVPLARFPTSLAVVRVQSAAPHSRSGGVSYGRGAYSVVLTPTVETKEHLDQLRELEKLTGVVRLNRLVLGQQLRTDKELRNAAARLHADFVLIYTINTEWTIDEDPNPLNAITFGISRFKNITVTSTATALLLGTHNGFVYATSEVARDKKYQDNAWRNSEQIEEAQELLEQEAFDGLVESFTDSWPQLINVYTNSSEARR